MKQTNDRVNNFFCGLAGRHVVMVGAGRSNGPLISRFVRAGARVTVCDRRSREALGETARNMETQGAVLQLGNGYLDRLDGDMIFRSPGVPYLLPQLQDAQRRGIAVTSEMEIFMDICPARVYGVTGSDGKTTTTTLISEMLKRQGKRVYLGGNIGRSLLPLVEEMTADDAAVVELSSFQLISMRRSPDVAVVTNITPNHLDVHKDMDEYIAAKKNVFLHQNAFGRTVLNADNAVTAAFVGQTRGDTRLFSRQGLPAGARGVFSDQKGGVFADMGSGAQPFLQAKDIRLPGMHNLENYLAAAAAVWDEVTGQTIARVAVEFDGVEHRIEFVRELEGVKWYNDSIATSPTRTIAGLQSFPQKTVLIAGGYDKQLPFDSMAEQVVDRVKILILMGDTADRIEQCVRNQPGFAQSGLCIIRAKSMEESVVAARGKAASGDVVMLSPACASFDLYEDFAARGNHFKQLVNGL